MSSPPNTAYSHIASTPVEGHSLANHLNGQATVDLDREARQGFPEVIYGERKSPEITAEIAAKIYSHSGRLLVTRASSEHFTAVSTLIAEAKFDPLARCIYIEPNKEAVQPHIANANVSIICAGTSDLNVALEASITLRVGGVGKVNEINDVGVAGIHRLLDRQDDFRNSDVIIVAAGMEGALPSVVGGLVSCPVIAVPTSVGYGASFQGVAALLGMLNSCASGLTVVNIDNGFGAAMAAMRILSLKKGPSTT
ncbi:MAG TPA: nickel pincer cofactor biosynthesis protein LarB [Candidatus Kapabacteria bacterium]|nr:nickel pincer cofactor biosynthesis protein LarB [Candidatus Kapabacteria bacterium]